ncbi:MAG: RIP metalloprotease RseP [Candidatus Cloacimonetes bacterium]|nr:RIP metalloprotease RseP [Candidatus Cloacimonadota bacterium]MBS3766864.1 RIP metalloprotease RseP [Candidatus Cloacimonadota bacterium]
MITILAVILLLGILVFVHEFGHFLAAKLSNVKVEKFSFGFGPKLIGFTKGETEYRISLIPLGGYVKMLGENPEEEDIAQAEIERSFLHKKWWQKVFIAFNGPFFNFIFAVLILSLTYIIGIKTYDIEPVVGRNIDSESQKWEQLEEKDRIIAVDGVKVDSWIDIVKAWSEQDKEVHKVEVIRDDEKVDLKIADFHYRNWLDSIRAYVPPVIGNIYYGLPAYKAGLEEGDIVLQIQDNEIEDWYDLRKVIQENPNEKLKFTIKRDGKILQRIVEPQLNPESKDDTGVVGITQKLSVTNIERYDIFTSIKFGFLGCTSLVYRYYNGLVELFGNPSQMGKNMGGPIMIAAMTKQQAESGLSSYLSFMAMISIILMIMNLLPIPILDGGQIIFSLIEGIAGKPLNQSVQAFLQRVGLVIIMALMFFAFYNDISRFVTRQFSGDANQAQEVETQ